MLSFPFIRSPIITRDYNMENQQNQIQNQRGKEKMPSMGLFVYSTERVLVVRKNFGVVNARTNVRYDRTCDRDGVVVKNVTDSSSVKTEAAKITKKIKVPATITVETTSQIINDEITAGSPFSQTAQVMHLRQSKSPKKLIQENEMKLMQLRQILYPLKN